MKLCNLIYYTFLSTIIFQLTQQIDLLNNFHSLKREMRFTRFDLKFVNQFPGVILESAFKQNGVKQALFIHLLVQKIITELYANFSIYKCKEYYIDCINVISYDVSNLCSKLKGLSFYTPLFNLEQYSKMCPLFGEYQLKNFTIDPDKFMPSFTYPTEKWWELYWKFNIIIYNETKSEIIHTKVDFYFIEFRSKHHN